jgi:hypothetical protein
VRFPGTRGEAMLSRIRLEEKISGFAGPAAIPRERRGHKRHLTILRVGTLVAEDKRELCLIRNISAGGLMALVYSSYQPGDRITVEFKTAQQVSGTVLWARDSNIGMAFDHPVAVDELLSNPPVLENGWRTRMPRVGLDRLATVRAGARVHWVTTCDISLGGVRIATDQPLEPGSQVVVTLDRFRSIAGVVRWQKEGEAGIAFNQVIPFQELKQWLALER